MAHYEQAFQTLPDNLGSYFRLEENEIAFVDPLYGDRLGVWPRILEHDAICRTGRQYLQGAAHSLDIIHTPHGAPEDFKAILREHGSVLEAAAVIAIETDWDPAYIDDFSNPAVIKMPGGVREAFTRTQIEWAQDQGKIILPYDIDGPDDPLRRSLLKLFEGDIDPRDIPFPPEVPAEKRPSLVRDLSSGAYTSLRHPMFIGQLGFGLSTLAQGGHIPPDARVAATLGSWHYPFFVAKARASGILPAENISSLTIEQPTIDRGSDPVNLVVFQRMAATASMTTVDMLAR